MKMVTKNRKQKKREGDFATLIEEIRDDLTTKISKFSSSESIDIETTKLLKEMTSIVKELDKMVKDNDISQLEDRECDDKESFYQFIKEQSLLKEE